MVVVPKRELIQIEAGGSTGTIMYVCDIKGDGNHVVTRQFQSKSNYFRATLRKMKIHFAALSAAVASVHAYDLPENLRTIYQRQKASKHIFHVSLEIR